MLVSTSSFYLYPDLILIVGVIASVVINLCWTRYQYVWLLSVPGYKNIILPYWHIWKLFSRISVSHGIFVVVVVCLFVFLFIYQSSYQILRLLGIYIKLRVASAYLWKYYCLISRKENDSSYTIKECMELV